MPDLKSQSFHSGQITCKSLEFAYEIQFSSYRDTHVQTQQNKGHCTESRLKFLLAKFKEVSKLKL